MKVRRVGTFTLGIVLMGFGVAFLLHGLLGTLDYEMIFRCWPLVPLLLGGEVLLSAFSREETAPRYDFGAVVILILMSGFSMVMATAQFMMETLPPDFWTRF